jgi:hypothetical protein
MSQSASSSLDSSASDRIAAHAEPLDGLVAFVKRACPTCTLIAPQMREVARAMPGFRAVSQDDPRFPEGVGVIDDRDLDRSWLNRIEATPTLVRFEHGREVERVLGWDRAAWRRLTGIESLGEDLPLMRPG